MHTARAAEQVVAAAALICTRASLEAFHSRPRAAECTTPRSKSQCRSSKHTRARDCRLLSAHLGPCDESDAESPCFGRSAAQRSASQPHSATPQQGSGPAPCQALVAAIDSLASMRPATVPTSHADPDTAMPRQARVKTIALASSPHTSLAQSRFTCAKLESRVHPTCVGQAHLATLPRSQFFRQAVTTLDLTVKGVPGNVRAQALHGPATSTPNSARLSQSNQHLRKGI